MRLSSHETVWNPNWYHTRDCPHMKKSETPNWPKPLHIASWQDCRLSVSHSLKKKKKNGCDFSCWQGSDFHAWFVPVNPEHWHQMHPQLLGLVFGALFAFFKDDMCHIVREFLLHSCPHSLQHPFHRSTSVVVCGTYFYVGHHIWYMKSSTVVFVRSHFNNR